MSDVEVAVCACVGADVARGPGVVPAVRDLALRRRRSRIPGIYAVYHATPLTHRKARRDASAPFFQETA